jgi:hypothetical protein
MRLHRHRLPREPGDIRNRPRMPDLGGVAEGPEGHIEPGSTIVHDGLMAHRRLIEALGSADEVYKSTVKDEASLKAMLMINSFSSWAKRYLDRFTGMRTKYLQDYLNWFALRLQGEGAGRKMAENGEIAQAFAPQHRKLQAFMVTFSQHFRVLLEIFSYSPVSYFVH